MSASVDDAIQDTVSESQVVEQIRSGPPHARVRELLVEEDERYAIGSGFTIR